MNTPFHPLNPVIDRPFVAVEEDFEWAAIFRHADDLDFLRELASMMQEIAPRLLAEIHDAIERHAAVELEQAAHRLKGSLIPFVAAAAMDAAQSLESMGRVDDLSHASREYLLLDADVQRLLAALKQVASPEGFAARDSF